MKNLLLAVIATVLFVPSFARAEFAPHDSGDVRPAPTKRTKIEHAPTRVALGTVPRLTVDEVLSKINTLYMGGIQRCYRRSLVADPTLSGKVVLAFQVDDAGHVLMDAGTQTFDQCMARMVVGWKFTAPANDAESHYRINLILQPF